MLELSGIGDIGISIRNGAYEDARRFRRRFKDAMRLLDDLGWDPADPREAYELTMPRKQREWTLRHYKRSAEETLACWRDDLLRPRHSEESEEQHAEGIREARRMIDEERDLRSACIAALEAGER